MTWKPIMISVLFSVVCLSCRPAKPVRHIPSYAGPYDIIVRSITNKSDEFKTSGKFGFKLDVTRGGRGKTQYIWGFSELAEEIGDDHRGESRIDIWSNNQWKMNAFVMKLAHFCSDVVLHSPFVLTLLFGDDGKKCPIAPGLRQIPNQSVVFKYPKFPVFPYGHWRENLLIKKGDENKGVMIIEMDVIPKL